MGCVASAGAPKQRAAPAGGRPLALWLAALALAGCSGCAGDERAPPDRLLDGTPARPVPVELEGADAPAILTGAAVPRVLTGEGVTSCRTRWGRRRVQAAVERVGALAESVTLLESTGRAVLACDDSAGPREDDRRWCGAAYGRLHGGRLRDPRLDVLCVTEDGSTLGLAWVEPAPGAAYVAVEQDGWVEVYERVGSLPIRISTLDVDRERSAATFEVSEHRADGRLLRRYRLESAVAG